MLANTEVRMYSGVMGEVAGVGTNFRIKDQFTGSNTIHSD